MPIAIIAVKIVGGGIIGDEQVGPTVVIEICPKDTQTVIAGHVVHARRLGDICEGAVSIVVIEAVTHTLHAPWPTLDGDAAKMTGRADAKLRQVVQVELHITRNHGIHEAVAIVVGEGRTGRPAGIGQVGLLGHVSEGSVTIVAVEHESLFAGNENVGPTIVVVVGYGTAHGPTGITHTRLIGHVAKRAVTIVVIENALGLMSVERLIHTRTIREVDVQPAVLIVVQQQYATTHRLHQILFLRRQGMFKLDVGGCRNVSKPKSRSWGRQLV